MVRSGDEPVHARSPLRLRLVLAVFGLVVSGGGALLWWWAGVTPLALVFAGFAVVAAVDLWVVRVRIRQGAHYQPGPDVPPYRPVDPLRARPARPPRMPSAGERQGLYLALMLTCVALIALAWTWVRTVSTGAAIVMSLVAMVIPPVAAIVANAGWQERPPPERHDPGGDGVGRPDG